MLRKTFMGFALCLMVVNDAWAGVWKISRACQWSTIPACVNILNLVPDGICWPRSNLPGGQYYEQFWPNTGRFWSLEGFTTDFWPQVTFPNVGRARNWLWVAINAYRAPYPPYQVSSQSPGSIFSPHSQYISGWMEKWTTSELPIVLDYIYFRARAGTGSWQFFFLDMDPYGDISSFRVNGFHWYYDTVAHSLNDIGVSSNTNNCDLGSWGFYGENNASI